jgi:hypothetical protein
MEIVLELAGWDSPPDTQARESIAETSLDVGGVNPSVVGRISATVSNGESAVSISLTAAESTTPEANESFAVTSPSGA